MKYEQLAKDILKMSAVKKISTVFSIVLPDFGLN